MKIIITDLHVFAICLYAGVAILITLHVFLSSYRQAKNKNKNKI